MTVLKCPEVLVFGAVEDRAQSTLDLAVARRCASNVLDALRTTGLRGRLADTARALPAVAELIRLARSGLILLGGGDVDPDLYGHAARVHNVYGVDREIDEIAVDLIRECVARGVPVLGICRGAQLLNVALGGSLIPDIANGSLHHGPTPEDEWIKERVTFSGSQLPRIFGCQSLEVVTAHHGAVDRLGAGLEVCARATDGLVEAIRLTHSWGLGVQWHPEHDSADVEQRRLLFKSFGGAVLNRASASARNQQLPQCSS